MSMGTLVSVTCAACAVASMAYINLGTNPTPEFTCNDCKSKKEKKKKEAKRESNQCLCYPCWKARYCRDHSCKGCKACTDYVCAEGQVHHTSHRFQCIPTAECVVIDADDPEVVTYVDYVTSSSSSTLCSSCKPKKKGIFSFTVPGAWPIPSGEKKKKKKDTSRFRIYKNESNGIYTEFEEYEKGKLRPVRMFDMGSGRWVDV